MVMCKGNQKFTQTNQMKHKYEKKDKKTSYIYMFPKGADQLTNQTQPMHYQ